jgi:hypothetical protein
MSQFDSEDEDRPYPEPSTIFEKGLVIAMVVIVVVTFLVLLLTTTPL